MSHAERNNKRRLLTYLVSLAAAVLLAASVGTQPGCGSKGFDPIYVSDEICADPDNTCSAKATCTADQNAPLGYRCTCGTGYEGDGVVCQAQCATPIPWPPTTTERYVGPEGTDRADCGGGTRADPWATFRGPQNGDCITPGMAVYFLAGSYESTSVLGAAGTMSALGTESAPVLVAPDPQAAGDWPVSIRGEVQVFASWIIVEGLEFVRLPSEDGVRPVGTNIIIRDNYIHGDDATLDYHQKGPGDCVKILSDRTINGSLVRTTNVQLIGNEIAYCQEDAIDVTGARDVLYRDNHIHHAYTIQIKGGTENVLVERNYIHHVHFGFTGWSMGCPDEYCGSPDQPLLPVEQRFVAKNVTLRNNRLHDIYGPHAIFAGGWVDSRIEHNTFATLAKSVLVVGVSGFDFFDDAARNYCASNPCEACKFPSSSCWHIGYGGRNVLFENNIVYAVGQYALNLQTGSQDVTAQGNLYYNPGGVMSFTVAGSVTGLADFPYDSGSSESDPKLVDPASGDLSLYSASPAIDASVDSDLCDDSFGQSRDTQPDVGAVEYQ